MNPNQPKDPTIEPAVQPLNPTPLTPDVPQTEPSSPFEPETYTSTQPSAPLPQPIQGVSAAPDLGPTLPQVPTMTEVTSEIPASPFATQESQVDASPMPISQQGEVPVANSSTGQIGTSSIPGQVPPLVPSQQGPITATSKPKNFSRFKLFIMIAVILIVAIYSVVTFLYLQNKKLKEAAQETPQPEEVVTPEEETPLPTVVPPVVATNDNVKILNGNVVMQVSTDEESKILVDKKDYSSTGITGFARVAVSNDGKMLCFESWPPAPEPALYISNSDGSDVKEVSPNRQNCLWSKDNSSLYYSDYSSKTLSKNIFSYLLATEEEKNLTVESQPSSKNRSYELVGLSADGGKLVCKYSESKTLTGDCEIDLATLEVTLSESQ